MKQKKKRFFAGIFALLTLLGFCLGSSVPVCAAGLSSVTKMWAASAQKVGEVKELWPGLEHNKVQYAMIDGCTAYCMNYGLRGYKGLNVTGSSTRSTVLTGEQERELMCCLYYGFSTTEERAPSEEEACAYIATQTLLWNIVGGIFNSGQDDSAAATICASASNPEAAYTRYESLKAQVNAALQAGIPAFAGENAGEAPLYELAWSEQAQRYEITLEDTGGVSSRYDISLEGYQISRNENGLTIFSEKVNTAPTTAFLRSNAGDVRVTDSCLYWLTGLEGYQEFVSGVPEAVPLQGYFQVKTGQERLGSLVIYKEGEVLVDWNGSSFVYEKQRLPGAEFRLSAWEDIYRGDGTLAYAAGQVVADGLVTDETGGVTVTDLPLGTYLVEETKGIGGYVLDKAPKMVEVKYHGLMAEVSYETTEVYNTRQKALVSIQKQDKDTEEPLAGGQYTLYAGNAIQNRDGRVIVEEGAALETVTTGVDGTAFFSLDLPVGNHYEIRETKAPEGYSRDTGTAYVFWFGDLEETAETAAFTDTFWNELLKEEAPEEEPAPKTGDKASLGGCAGLMAASLVCLVATEKRRKRS